MPYWAKLKVNEIECTSVILKTVSSNYWSRSSPRSIFKVERTAEATEIEKIDAKTEIKVSSCFFHV